MCGAAVLALVAAVLATVRPSTTVDSQPQRSSVTAVSTTGSTTVPATGTAAGTPEAGTPLIATPPATPPSAVVEAAERAAAPGMVLGVAVLDVQTGELASGRHGARPFISASLSKLIVVVDMLQRRRTEGLVIDAAGLDLVGRALRGSDDAAMNVLWGRYDGHRAISRVAAALGLGATRAPADPTQWGDTRVTAADFALIYRHLLRDLPAEDRGVIIDTLATAHPVAVDGFEQFFGLLRNGASPQVYAKQAWVPYRPAGYLLHSAGVVHAGHDYVIILLTTQSQVSAQTARDRLSAVAAAAVAAIG